MQGHYYITFFLARLKIEDRMSQPEVKAGSDAVKHPVPYFWRKQPNLPFIIYTTLSKVTVVDTVTH